MSDIEEPPAKVAKYEMSQSFTQPDEMDEGQEEWLSEDVLTDEDYNGNVDHDRSDSALGYNSVTSSQNNSNHMPNSSQDASQYSMEKIDGSDIEQTLDSLDSGQTRPLPGELGAFLVRKSDSRGRKEVRREESDGNDTDDLLRMLEDDDRVKKTKVLKKTERRDKEKQIAAPETSDDDDFIFEGSSVTKLKVAKNVLRRTYPPAKAVQEDTSEGSDESGDEEATMKKMFGVKRQKNYASKSTARPASKQTKSKTPAQKKAVEKQISQNSSKNFKTYSSQVTKKSTAKSTYPAKDKLSKKPTFFKEESIKFPNSWEEHEEIIDEEEYLEDDNFDLNEDFAAESETEMESRAMMQRIMEPETLDEDMLSDAASLSEAGSLYEELPSSDYEEDNEDWFTLDIRSERAGDYIPLLGKKAYELLLEEKRRVSNRLEALRKSVGLLADSGRRQSERLRDATQALADVTDLLRAA